VEDAAAFVEEHFPSNPGSTDFIWPTSHQEAASWLKDFVENRLDGFGPYADAVDKNAAWIYHSALSSSLNIGLLNPQQVVEAALERHAKRPVPLQSLEALIRQILGWREFMRAQYVTHGEALRTTNVLAHRRRLTNDWYAGTTGLPPFDDIVKKVDDHAYAHHVERLMVAGNLMLLCEIDPMDIYKWYSELFIDAYDWVMVPNVFTMSQFADEGQAMAKPYVASSNYILQMSSYERGEWCDTWDGLFWRFIDKHKSALYKNPQMRTLVQRLDRLDADRRRIIHYRAEDFLNKFTR
jgi:deoxyribodipyrimidine photolyase-related protein